MTPVERRVYEILQDYQELKRMAEIERRQDYGGITERLARLEEKVDNLICAINGNGEPGLLSRVRVLEIHFWRSVGVVGAASFAFSCFLFWLQLKKG